MAPFIVDSATLTSGGPVSVSPRPAVSREHVHVRGKSLILQGHGRAGMRIVLTDLHGKVLVTRIADALPGTIDLPACTAGALLLVVYDENNSVVLRKRLIVR
jgi:hypothetical protein